MTRRNLITSFMVVAASALLFGGVAFAREQQTPEARPIPAATQAAPTFDDNGIDATESPELQAGDDRGVGSDDGAEASASPDDHGVGSDDGAEASASPDDHGVGSDDAAAASASPSADDKTPKPSARATSSVEDGGSHRSSH